MHLGKRSVSFPSLVSPDKRGEGGGGGGSRAWKCRHILQMLENLNGREGEMLPSFLQKNIWCWFFSLLLSLWHHPQMFQTFQGVPNVNWLTTFSCMLFNVVAIRVSQQKSERISIMLFNILWQRMLQFFSGTPCALQEMAIVAIGRREEGKEKLDDGTCRELLTLQEWGSAFLNPCCT